MAKSLLTSVLLFVAFSQMVHAGPFGTNLTQVATNIKDQVVDLVDKTTDEVKGGVNQLNTLVNNTFNSAKDVAANSTSHITEEYIQVLDKVNSIVSSNSFLSEECNLALNAFREAYGNLIENTNACVDKRIQAGVSHMTKINAIADEVMHELTVVRDNAIQCTTNIHGVSNLFQALTCVNNAALKATLLVGKRVPSLTLEMSKLGGNIALLPPQIGYCFSTQFLSVVGSSYKETLSKVNKCIIPSAMTTALPALPATLLG